MAGAGSQFHLAILGAEDPAGQSFLRALEEADIPVGILYPLSLNAHEDLPNIEFRGESWPCVPAEGFVYDEAQALVVTAAHAASATREVAAVRARLPHMPVLEANAVAPGPAVAIARVLAALQACCGVQSADAFVSLPVALAGLAGVDELVNQSRGLFNLESPEPEIFPLQIAFNQIPLPADGGRYQPEALAQGIAQLGVNAPVRLSVVWAPLFYAATVALHVRPAQAPTALMLREALKKQDGVLLMASDLPAGNPTPATDASDSDAVFLGQMAVESDAIRLWLVFDPARLEAGLRVAQVENWIDRPMNSVLT